MPAALTLAAEAQALTQAAALMRLGARRPVIEAETGLSGERLTRLFREVTGQAPSRGQLPHSPDWFLGGAVALQAALFDAWHRRIRSQGGASGLQALTTAYRLYLEEVQRLGLDPVLDFTRAWSLQRFLAGGLLVRRPCPQCGLLHLAAPHQPGRAVPCAGCRGPSGRHGQRQPAQAMGGAMQARATASATFRPSTPADKMPPA